MVSLPGTVVFNHILVCVRRDLPETWRRETLTTAQETAVAKSSTVRLRLLLMWYGYAEEVVLMWMREELMNKCRTAGPRN